MSKEQRERFNIITILLLGLIFIFAILCLGYHFVTGEPIIIDLIVEKNKAIEDYKNLKNVEIKSIYTVLETSNKLVNLNLRVEKLEEETKILKIIILTLNEAMKNIKHDAFIGGDWGDLLLK